MKKETLFRAGASCLAMLFLSLFVACSDDSGNSPSNQGTASEQVYVATSETNFASYTGSGDVSLALETCEERPKIGTVAGGKLTYTLPASVSAGCLATCVSPASCLALIWPDVFEIVEALTVTVEPATALIATTEGLLLSNSEMENAGLIYYSINRKAISDGSVSERWMLQPIYFSTATTISGAYNDGETHTFDIEAKAGWNWIVVKYLSIFQGDNESYEWLYTSDLNLLPSDMKWVIMD
jgi:hypothetical protein